VKEQDADLEVVRQLLTACISRVHGDEDGTGRVQHQLRPFEQEPGHSLVDGDLNALDLLGYHRQHFQFDAVEFVETRPGTGLSQTLEELAHRFVVEAVGTVEHHALNHTAARPTRYHLH